MQFFTDCRTKEETTTLFRKLSKCFHPDVGGESVYMVELIKQYENWKPGQSFERERIIFQPSYEVNPRMEILERELARLRKLTGNPLQDREIFRLRQSVSYLNDQLKQSGERNEALASKVWDLENQLKHYRKGKEEINEMMTALLQENINHKAKKGDEPDIPIEMTLWQKIKYVIGEKCPKSYI